MSFVQEELAEGLHLIDFEQLKIENQTYNEKIEERNEVSGTSFSRLAKLNPFCLKTQLVFRLRR